MEIMLAKNSGFCFGVRNAVDITLKTIKDNPKARIRTLGPIIHNPQFVRTLTEKGVEIVDSVDDVDKGILITRAHGTGESIIKKAKDKGLRVIDLVCPFVKQIHDIKKEYLDKGYKLVIFGELGHPEVQGIVDTLKDCEVVSSARDLKHSYAKVLLVSQTTQEESKFDDVARELKRRAEECVVKNTICNATKLRQESARDTAKKVDLMIVIGGKNSGNTRRLFDICGGIVKTIHIETKGELKKEMFKGVKKVGVSAGASTPDFIIQDVIGYLKRI